MTVVLYVLASIAAAFAVSLLVKIYWRGASLYRIRRAGPRRLIAERQRIWRDPQRRGPLDLAAGPGGMDGRPVPPFTFVEEPAGGSQPSCAVTDAADRRWRVKWGHEVRCETFAVRLAWALGYFAEVTHFVPSGTIRNAAPLDRTRDCIDADGRFIDARFELDDPSVRKLFEEHSWAWNDNPFVGTRQLDGLKMVVMLLSNWDAKDRRDVARGSNTAIFEQRVSAWRHEARYLITDWGGSMGRWGSTIVTRGRWDIDGFEAQTREFVRGVRDGCLVFGYSGQRTADIAHGITAAHARWFYRLARRLTDQQLVAGLRASGATDDEAERFARAFRDRIDQIGRAAAPPRAGDGDLQ
jgi:hypothetical protein